VSLRSGDTRPLSPNISRAPRWHICRVVTSGAVLRRNPLGVIRNPLLQSFEAIGSLLCPLVAARVYQAVLRQSINGRQKLTLLRLS
jgi:hypothetical protein